MTRGLPTPPADVHLALPAATLAGSKAVLIGSGFATRTAHEALAALGADVVFSDAADPGEAARWVGAADADILVLGATLSPPRPAEDIGPADWRDGPGRELATAFAVLSAFGARRGERGGVALVLLDPVALLGGPGVSAAAAAHAGLVNLAQSLAVEWAPRDIRVNALAVGRFEGGDSFGGLPGNIPALRLGQARELGWMVSYLCSPFAAYVTGTCVTIDGGDSLRRNLLEPRYSPGEFLATATSPAAQIV
ncbi:SDR family oxidoreductase [Nocardia sp. NPDC047654]|uniref:SDR family oxidoreductase n=1 Tax=Nocardia sp. NPDC047654 TaxID=3364314 RepID=UPI00371DAFB9